MSVASEKALRGGARAYRHVIFDADDTLLRYRDDERGAFSRLFARHNVAADDELLAFSNAVSERIWTETGLYDVHSPAIQREYHTLYRAHVEHVFAEIIGYLAARGFCVQGADAKKWRDEFLKELETGGNLMDGAAETLTELMRLTAISDVYEPGSTFKILTAASALDSGVTTPQDSFYCSAKITVDGDTIRCWGRPHGAETMADGLKNSCNPVFVELALRMGTDTFYRYLTAFGLGKKTGIDLPGESPGILITSRNVKRVDLARIGFGQSVALTPIQMMMAANSVINGGKLMKPYIVSEIQTPDGETLERFHPTVMAAPIRPETSDTMRLLLERVVSEGGGKNAAIAGYRIGGKTGTAQVYKNGRVVRDTHIGSFYGFAPVNDPQVSILVIVKEADVPIDYGGTTAAPFARQIMQEMLPYLGIDPKLKFLR